MKLPGLSKHLNSVEGMRQTLQENKDKGLGFRV